MKKVVLKLNFSDERTKQKAMKNVSSLSGVDSIAIDTKDKKLTVIGDIDPVTIVAKLRKICHTEIVSVGPAKDGGDDKKKEEDKKKAEEKKKEDEKKKKAEEDKKKAEEAAKIAFAYQQAYPYYNYPPTPYYSKVVHDETPSCVIC